jgi:hypothetical protein
LGLVRYARRSLGIAPFYLPPGAFLLAFAASGSITRIFACAARQFDHFRTYGLCNRIKLRFADMYLEEFQIASFYSDNSKSWKSFAFSNTISLTYKNLCH